MSKITKTKKIRKYFGEKDNKIYDSLPLESQLCLVCKKEIKVADGTISNYHGCCRKFRSKKFYAPEHIKECHA